ncbi:hypothetical protein XH93_11060 [Bradyrhizobium sp. CCBAU 51753]|nr:hypothetical protein XH93_11060 [Bradyrhizobium sp. CCBAU 51753]
MADGNVCKLRAIALIPFRRCIPFAASAQFGGILEAPSDHSADRRPVWASVGLIDFLLSHKIECINDINLEAIFKLPDQTFVGRTNGANQNRIHDIRIVSSIGAITFARFWPQVSYPTNVHEFIGRAAIKGRIFIADEPVEVGRLTPLSVRNQIGIMVIRSMPVKICQLPATWMPAHGQIVHLGDMRRYLDTWPG